MHTDVWRHFAGRVATYTIDGEISTGVHVFDLTLDEVRRLRTHQRWPFRDQSHNGLYGVATFEEYLDVVSAAPRVVSRCCWASAMTVVLLRHHHNGLVCYPSSPNSSAAWRISPRVIHQNADHSA